MPLDISFTTLVYAWTLLAVVVFFVLLRVRAPYGRYATARWGPSLPHRAGWITMELVSPTVFLLFFLRGGGPPSALPWLFAALWVGHYANRAIVYPIRQRSSSRRMPVVILLSGIVVNTVNGYFNGHYLGALAPPYPLGWPGDPRFLAGALLFAAGSAINVRADRVLRGLRAPGESGYGIPHGGMYRWVSCPNYLGEIVQWTGFALMTWSLPAAAFAIWTVANLVPRAVQHHRWYRVRFPDYPDDRKALLPGLL